MNKKQWYIVGGSIAGVIVLYFVYDLIKTKQNKALATSNETSSEGGQGLNPDQESSQGAKKSQDAFPMQVGSYGYKVSLLQSALNKLGAKLLVDGKFGQSTHKAVYDYGDEWSFLCYGTYLCGLTEEEYNNILAKAINKGWAKSVAETEASKQWSAFTADDDYLYSNLR